MAFACPSGVRAIKVGGLLESIDFINMGQTHTHICDRHTYGTDTHVGQTHIWDRHTFGQAHMAYEKQSSC